MVLNGTVGGANSRAAPAVEGDTAQQGGQADAGLQPKCKSYWNSALPEVGLQDSLQGPSMSWGTTDETHLFRDTGKGITVTTVRRMISLGHSANLPGTALQVSEERLRS